MLDILAYTTYIHAYILRISCVYLAHVTNTYMYACYTTYLICSIYCVYTCVYTAYILRISGVCLLTYRSRDLYIGLFYTYLICSIYCVYTCVYTTHIIAYLAYVANMVYMHCLTYLIYSVYIAYILHISLICPI